MSILKNFRLDPWVVRTLKAIQEANKESSEKQTIVVLINNAAAQIGLLFKPCPNAKSIRKGKKGIEIECSREGNWLLFDPNCLECQTWRPTPVPAPSAKGDG